jgi:hypothetical protein
MALVLPLRQGQEFYVADLRVVVSKLLDEGGFELHVLETDHRYEVGEEEPVEMKEAEEVWFQSGGRSQSGVVMVIIDAPKEIPVTRGRRAAAA